MYCQVTVVRPIQKKKICMLWVTCWKTVGRICLDFFPLTTAYFSAILNILSWRFDHGIFSMVILSLQLIQEGQLSVSGNFKTVHNTS